VLSPKVPPEQVASGQYTLTNTPAFGLLAESTISTVATVSFSFLQLEKENARIVTISTKVNFFIFICFCTSIIKDCTSNLVFLYFQK
jgi:hypothetical protein